MQHDWRIEPREYERHESRRGRRHGFEHIAPRRTALIVIDMVPFFVEANPYTAGIVANIARLAETLRTAGGTVAWVVPAATPPSPARVEFLGPDIAERYRQSGGGGAPRDRLWHELTPDRTDLVVEKTAASPFFVGASPLHEMLRSRGVDTVIVTGTVANVCCESTVRDAAELGYRTIMVADANSAQRDADLNATLHTVYRSFGDVRPTVELLDLIEGGLEAGDGGVDVGQFVEAEEPEAEGREVVAFVAHERYPTGDL